jgi:hypothetical protein
MDIVWFVLFVAGIAGLWFVAYRIEPHWSSRDGRRFVCNAQELSGGTSLGRNRETQIAVLPDGLLHVSRKKLMRRNGSVWRLTGRSDGPSPKVLVYLARQVSDGSDQLVDLALRIPRSSRCVPVLDALLPGGTSVAAATPDPAG